MARKIPKNLLALASAAIVGVYAVGFARTAITPASAGSGVQTSVTAGSATQAAPVDASTAIARAVASATATTTQTASPLSTAAYRDGTYSGTGTSRLGNISTDVTVQGGQITAVRITNATTHYSTSRISQLPGQVVSRQSANVSLVSGATSSSNAFKQAVAQALAQASATA